MATVRTVSIDELHGALADQQVPVLVDVRTAMEFGSGHIPGAIHVPMGQIEAAELPDEVWVVCRSGTRSARVAQGLAAQGKRVVDVAGGTLAWSAAGHGLARSAGSPTWTRWLLPIAACLTLGLAPFVPEPHLVGKLRWVAGGAVGMSAMDAFDLCLHGAPFVWLGWTAVGSRGRAV